MTKPRHPKSPQDSAPTFVVGSDDRFHSILVSDGVRHETAPDHETVLTFFTIRRANGLYDIVNVMKTFKGSKCTLRNVQTKADIPASAIAQDVNAVVSAFGGAIEKSTGYKLIWHRLDLMNVEAMQEQVMLVKDWGRVGVRTEIGLI